MEISNKKFNLEFNNIIILYRHYKDYFLPVGVILACILMVFLVVIPQFQQYLKSQEELKTQTQKLEVLKNNYNFLSNLDNSKSSSDLNTLSLVLPPNKDFAGIMNAISFVAAKTGTSVGDFEFSVGDISGVVQGVTAYPSIKIDVNLVGNTQALMQFVAELYKTAPASEITSVKAGGASGSITVLFYYKPFPPQNVDDAAPITFLSDRDTALVKSVSSWNNATNQPLIPFIPSIFSPSSIGSASSSESSPSPF